MMERGLSLRGGDFVPIVILFAFILLAFFVLWFFSSVTIPFLGAIIVAYIFSPIVDWLERYHVPRFLSAFLVLAVILGAFFTLAFWVVPLIVNEVRSLVVSIPRLNAAFGDIGDDLSEFFPSVSWESVTQDAIGLLEGLAKGFLASLPEIVGGLLMVVYNAVIIPFLLFFFLKDGRTMIRGFIDLVPNKYFEMIVTLLQKIDFGLGRFLRGILIENCIVGSFAVLNLTIIGMPSAFFVGVLIGIFNVIPYMGPTIGFLIPGILTLIDPGANPPLLMVMAAVAVVQLCDNLFFYPLIIGKSVHMHPVLVIAALLIGSFLLGFIGMILAVPIATSLVLIFTTFIQARREYGAKISV
jgi:predicted PurR-regulated permease PerM